MADAKGTKAAQAPTPIRKSTIDPNETKGQKFVRLANKRVPALLKGIDNLGNLASSNYEYTPEQVEKMFGAIQTRIDNARSHFEASTTERESFTL
jgi:hypothetical protein